MKPTIHIEARSGELALVELHELLVNRIPVSGKVEFRVDQGSITMVVLAHLYRTDSQRSVPMGAYVRARAAAWTAVQAWLETPEGAYAMLHEKVQRSEDLLRYDIRAVLDCEQRLVEAKRRLREQRREWRAAVKERRKLWDKQVAAGIRSNAGTKTDQPIAPQNDEVLAEARYSHDIIEVETED